MFDIFNRRKSLTVAAETLAQHQIAPALRIALARFLETGRDEEVAHLNPRHLAERLGIAERDVLKLLVAAVYEGLMTLHWDVRCPACGIGAHRDHGLTTLCHDETCAACSTVYAQRLDHEVRVTFSVQPRFRKIAQPTEHGKFREEVDTRLGTVSGQALLLLPDFQRLFPQEKLLPSESLEVARTVLLFTDLAGSTAMYARRGDPHAYHLVRLHFEVLFDRADRNNGTVVKNIGDAVMAAFATPVEAMRAALAMQSGLADLNRREGLGGDEALILKVGLHCGPCLSVTLNERPDYFGTTVNVAARVQGLSGGNDVVFTYSICNDAAITGLLAGRPLKTMSTPVKGLDEEWTVHSLALG